MVTASESTKRKPFSEVLKEWTNALDIPKVPQRAAQNSMIAPLDTNKTYPELEEEVEQLVSTQDKLIHVCKNGSDTESAQLLGKLLQTATDIKLAKVTDKQSAGSSLLHICAQKNKVKCMEILVEHGIPVDIRDSISASPLLHAVSHNRQEAVAFLLSKGANVNAKDSYNKWPLYIAVKNKHYEIAQMLISQQGIDVHLRGTKGNTALHFLAEEGDLKGVQFLIEKCKAMPQRRNNDEENVFFYALAYPDICNYLANYFAKNGLTKMLLTSNAYGRTLVHEAAVRSCFGNLLFILKYISPSSMDASQVQGLLNGYDKSGDTPLILSVKHYSKDMLKFLSECTEVRLNVADRRKNTALQHAVASKDEKMISILNACGASLTPESDSEEDLEEGLLYCKIMRSLTTMLVLLMSIIAIVCIVTIAAISIGFFASNVARQSADLRRKYFDSVEKYVSNELRRHEIAHTSSVAQVAGVRGWNVTNTEDVMYFSWQFYTENFQRNSLMISASCVDSNTGGVVGVISQGASVLVGDAYADPYRYKMYPVAASLLSPGQPLVLNESVAFFLNRTVTEVTQSVSIPYARRSRTHVWTQGYTRASFPNVMFFSFVSPFRDTSDQLIALCQTAISTSLFSDYLKSYDETEGDIVILERNSTYLVAASNEKQKVFTQDGSDAIRFDGVTDSEPGVASMIKAARKLYGGSTLDGLVPGEKKFSTYTFGGKRYGLNILRLSDDYELDWVIIQSVPMSQFYRQFRNSLIVISVCTLVLLIGSVIVSFVASKIFMSPLLSVISQAEEIKGLRLESVEQQLDSKMSYYTEVKSLQKAFRSMIKRLKQFRSFIPDHILAVIETEMQYKKERDEFNKETTQSKTSDSGSDKATSVTLNFGRKDLVNATLSEGLQSAVVSVLTLRMPDYTDILEVHSADDITETTRDLLTALKACIRNSNAQVVSIDSKNVVLTWNTFITQDNHRMRACKTAKSCIDVVKKLHEKWSQKGLPLLSIRIGISSGTVYYGNLGDSSMKFFTLIGKVVEKSSLMSEYSKKWNASVVCSDDIYEFIKEDYQMRPLERVNELEERFLVHELGEHRTTFDEDWANDLQHEAKVNSKNSPWSECIEGFDLYEKKEYEEAISKFNSYLEKNPTDSVCQNMLQKCIREWRVV